MDMRAAKLKVARFLCCRGKPPQLLWQPLKD
jgi:hypothetical protein